MLESDSDFISRVLQSSSEQESNWICVDYDFLESSGNKKRPLDEEVEEHEQDDQVKRKKSPQHPHTPDIKDVQHALENSDNHGNDVDYNDPSTFMNPLDRELTISCLLHLSRSYYGTVACINSSFRSLIRSGELYQLRRQMEIAEHWVYFSCSVLEWEAYDPYRACWITVPKMPPTESFMCSDKESLAVGTDLLVFGRELNSYIVLRYSILTNSWSPGVVMNSPRCLFGSASLGEKAIVAGGTNAQGDILSSAELYNSETQTWETLPSMNKARKMCSGVFMDRKFYVIGGMDSNKEMLTCGEEYDLERGSWRVIPNMSAGLNGASGAPPLVAVVNNDLYAAHYADKEVRKYNKDNNAWVTLGKLPERSVSVNGWGLAFRACGEWLIVIGGPRGSHGGIIELNSWIPNEGPPEWNMIASKHSGSFGSELFPSRRI
ncbi:Kelch motif [Musa troglodytarum]|uniref:Kelch motif n=1 Tax=Musa troglodytarum TaxID=320322 RepID=A0A9E7KVY1_9LILI|nr:Kelch motif [Musa troglodytarum]URE34181.1 Kelch motif [Musa troglodytarum]